MADYIDNDAFFKAIKKWKAEYNKAKREKRELPQVSDFIAECFLSIAQHLVYKPNFINYSYHDDFISDGVENCLLYAHNFNPRKSKNPFSYFTQIIRYAFIRRILKEQKQHHLKYMVIENNSLFNLLEQESGSEQSPEESLLRLKYTEYLQRYRDIGDKIATKKKKKKDKNSLEEFE